MAIQSKNSDPMKDTFNPVKFKTSQAVKRWAADPAFKKAYAALNDEFDALDKLLELRLASGLTQADIAEQMGIAQSSLARLESALTSRSTAPSLKNLKRYAEVFGKRLEFRLV